MAWRWVRSRRTGYGLIVDDDDAHLDGPHITIGAKVERVGRVVLTITEVTMEWRQITCKERDSLFDGHGDHWYVAASFADLDGRFTHPPEIFTQWEDAAGVQRLQDRRFPQPSGDKPDARPCEHYVPLTDLTSGAALPEVSHVE